jgi:hypothetical protein
MSTQLWILSGYVLFLGIVICFIGWLVIKKGEAILDKKKQDILESIEEVWPVKMAEVDEKLLEQHSNVILKLRKETAGMKEWVEKRLTGTKEGRKL